MTTAAHPPPTSRWARRARWAAPATFIAFAAAAILAMTTADDSTSSVRVTSARATPASAGADGAVYVTIDNPGSADRIRRIEVAGAAAAGAHRTEIASDGLSTMTAVDPLEVPARDIVAMAPGGLHIMAEDLSAPWVVGDVVTLELTFDRSGTVAVEAQVVEATELLS